MRSWDDYKKTMIEKPTLFSAAKANDVELLTMLQARGEDLNQTDHRGYSPLMLAVYAGHLEASQHLINCGADVNSTDAGGNSILMGACFKGHKPLVEILLKSGAQLDARNQANLSAYDFAVTFGRQEVARFLEEQGHSAKRRSRLISLCKLLFSRFRRGSRSH